MQNGCLRGRGAQQGAGLAGEQNKTYGDISMFRCEEHLGICLHTARVMFTVFKDAGGGVRVHID